MAQIGIDNFTEFLQLTRDCDSRNFPNEKFPMDLT